MSQINIVLYSNKQNNQTNPDDLKIISGENFATKISVQFPYEYVQYSKRVDFINIRGEKWTEGLYTPEFNQYPANFDTRNFTFTLSDTITTNGELLMQFIAYRSDGSGVFVPFDVIKLTVQESVNYCKARAKRNPDLIVTSYENSTQALSTSKEALSLIVDANNKSENAVNIANASKSQSATAESIARNSDARSTDAVQRATLADSKSTEIVNRANAREFDGLNIYTKYNTKPSDDGATDEWLSGHSYMGVVTTALHIKPTTGYTWMRIKGETGNLRKGSAFMQVSESKISFFIGGVKAAEITRNGQLRVKSILLVDEL